MNSTFTASSIMISPDALPGFLARHGWGAGATLDEMRRDGESRRREWDKARQLARERSQKREAAANSDRTYADAVASAVRKEVECRAAIIVGYLANTAFNGDWQKLADHLGVTVRYVGEETLGLLNLDKPGKRLGVFVTEPKAAWILNSLTPTQREQTTLHELGHALGLGKEHDVACDFFACAWQYTTELRNGGARR